MPTNPMPPDFAAIKKELYSLCQQYVQQRIQTARQAMEAAQESANAESKSSAGDKYETGRAMAQLERDRHARLLAQAHQLAQELTRLNVERHDERVQPGCLVMTSRGTFFISIGAGKLTIGTVDYVAVSPASPLAAALAGHKTGDVVTFNKIAYQVISVA